MHNLESNNTNPLRSEKFSTIHHHLSVLSDISIDLVGKCICFPKVNGIQSYGLLPRMCLMEYFEGIL